MPHLGKRSFDFLATAAQRRSPKWNGPIFCLSSLNSVGEFPLRSVSVWLIRPIALLLK
jgi:hypothetical protein